MGKIGRQIHATVKDDVGKLAELTDTLKAAGVNMQAVAAWVEGDIGHIVMVADDPDAACQAISPAVETCRFDQVVCTVLPNQAGALGEIAHKLAAAGIAIHLTYATTTGDNALVVLMTDDNAKAAELV